MVLVNEWIKVELIKQASLVLINYFVLINHNIDWNSTKIY